MQNKITENITPENGVDVVLSKSVQQALGGDINIKNCKKYTQEGVHVCVKDCDLINEEKLHEAGVELMFKVSNELVYLSPFLPS